MYPGIDLSPDQKCLWEARTFVLNVAVKQFLTFANNSSFVYLILHSVLAIHLYGHLDPFFNYEISAYNFM